VALLEQSRLHILGGWADERNERMAFAAADIAWLGYTGHWQSSGVMVQAAHMGLPLIASDEGVIGWSTKRHGNGLAVPVRRTAAVVEALQRLASSAELRLKLGERGRRAFAAHSPDNAGEILSAALHRALAPIGGAQNVTVRPCTGG
jgi:glycosyltransferase involved in cell wall biosynthesis